MSDELADLYRKEGRKAALLEVVGMLRDARRVKRHPLHAGLTEGVDEDGFEPLTWQERSILSTMAFQIEGMVEE